MLEPGGLHTAQLFREFYQLRDRDAGPYYAAVDRPRALVVERLGHCTAKILDSRCGEDLSPITNYDSAAVLEVDEPWTYGEVARSRVWIREVVCEEAWLEQCVFQCLQGLAKSVVV